jgi:hypothetical protein
VIAETVAMPLEEAINGVEGMLYMGSQATTDGKLALTVTFRLGTDPDKAQQLVQNRVAQAEPRLPEEVRRLGLVTVKGATDLTMVVHLVSPNERYDMTYLRNYAVLNVKDRLARVEAWARSCSSAPATIRCACGSTPAKVAERGLSAGDVRARHPRAEHPGGGGIIGASPSGPNVDVQLSINAHGRLQSEEEFGDIVVKTDAGGAVTRLRDIARLELGASEYALRSLLNNKPAGGDPRLRRAQLERDPDLGQRPRNHGRHQEGHARGRRLLHRLRPHAVRPRFDQGGREDAARGDPARGPGRDPLPADLARSIIRCSPCRCRDRHLRVLHLLRLLDQRASRSSAWCSRSASSWTTRSWWWRT